MQRWEYFLAADYRFDLSDVGHAHGWAIHQGGGAAFAPHRDIGDLPPDGPTAAVLFALSLQDATEEDAKLWARDVRAVRAIAGRRRKGQKLRSPSLDYAEAYQVMCGYVELLTPKLSASCNPKADLVLVSLSPAFPQAIKSFAVAASLFWQLIFASMIEGFPDLVCQDCGRSLGRTPKGRAKRSARCNACKTRTWKAKQDPEETRRKEREKKRAQREKNTRSTRAKGQ